jgi:hypothetical protein
MDLHEFEQLWPRRQELDEQMQARLDEMVRTDRHCRAFARGGAWVREMTLRTGSERAPADFAYRMGVYAKNNPHEDEPMPRRGYTAGGRSIAWPAVGVGLATGALLMALVSGPLGTGDALEQPGMATGAAGGDPQLEAPPGPVSGAVEQGGVAQADSARGDSLGLQPQDRPDWQLERVSTNQ